MVRNKAALWFAGVVSLFCVAGAAHAQPGFGGQQSQMTKLNDYTIPQLLQQSGYQAQTLQSSNGVKFWRVRSQFGGGFSAYIFARKSQQGKVTGLLIRAALTEVNPNHQYIAAKLLKLLDANELMSPYYFGYNPKTRKLSLSYDHRYNDSNASEMKRVLDRFFAQVQKTAPLWNMGGGFNNSQPPVNNKNLPPSQNTVAPKSGFNTAAKQVAGTVWVGSETLQGFGKLGFAFHSNGQALMVDAQGKVMGKWRQNGNQITIQFGDCVYNGVMNGNTISGQANGAQGAWQFTVTYAKNF